MCLATKTMRRWLKRWNTRMMIGASPYWPDELGDTANYRKYADFSKGYVKYFDPSTRFMRGLDSKGNWRTPFNPRSSNHRNDDYCEGTAWQWTWFVPHDVEGLVELMEAVKLSSASWIPCSWQILPWKANWCLPISPV